MVSLFAILRPFLILLMVALSAWAVDPLTTSVALSATSFSPAMGDVSTGKGVTSFGDVNGDGIADFAGYRRVYRGPLATPSAPVVDDPTQSLNLGTFVDLAIIPDLNGDGRDDLMLRLVDSSIPRVTYQVRASTSGGGAGAILFTVNFNAAGASITKIPTRMWVGDFTGDGRRDLAFYDDARGAILMVDGDGSGNWSGLTPSDTTKVSVLTLNGGAPFTGTLLVKVGNVDGDGDDDLTILTDGTLRDTAGVTATAGVVVVRRTTGATGASVQQVDGQGSRNVPSRGTVAGNTPIDLTVGDVDGDGAVEALAVVGYNPGSGAIPQSAALYRLGASPTKVAEVTPFTVDTAAWIVADVDGDDKADLYVVGDFSGNGVTAGVLTAAGTLSTGLANGTFVYSDSERLGYYNPPGNSQVRYRPTAVDLNGDGARQLTWVELRNQSATSFLRATPQLYAVEAVAFRQPTWQGQAQPWWFVLGKAAALTVYDGAQADYTITATGLTATKTGSVTMRAALDGTNDIDSDGDRDPSATYTLTPTATGSSRVATITARGGTSATFAYHVVPAISLAITGQTPTYAGEVGKPLTVQSTSGLAPLSFSATGATVVDNGAVAGSAVVANGSGGFSDLPRHTWTVTPAATGSLTIQVSETFGSTASITVNVVPAASLVLPSGSAAPTLGQAVQIAALNGGGSGHYTVATAISGTATVVAGSVFTTSNGLDLDNDTVLDYGQYFSVTPSATGAIVINLTQSSPFTATGSVTLAVDEPLGVRVAGQTSPYAGEVGLPLTVRVFDGAETGYTVAVSPATAATVAAGASFTRASGIDADGDGRNDAGRSYTVTPSSTTAFTVTAGDGEGRSASLSVQVVALLSTRIVGQSAPYALELGSSATLAVYRGQQPFTVTATGATVVAGVTFTAQDIDGTGQTANGQWFTVTPTATGTATVSAVDALQATSSLTITVAAPLPPEVLAVATPGLSATAVSLGQALTLIVHDGIGPYALNAPGAVVIATAAFTSAAGLDIDSDEDLDPGRRFLVIPTQVGTLTVTASDAAEGLVTTTFAVTALPAVTLAGPPFPLSSSDRTVFVAVCPGTPQGLSLLRSAFAGGAPTERRGFLWDALTQAFVESPTAPSGGFLPTQGWFVASRSALTLNFTGTPVPAPATLALRPGWNLIGIPPLQDGPTLRTSHLLGADTGEDFEVASATGAVLSGTGREDAIGVGAWWWDGAAYRKVTTLDSGVGYWIRNRFNDVVFVTRQAGDGSVGNRQVLRLAHRRLATDAETPPLPPGSGSGASAEPSAAEGSGCGSGSGLAGLLLALALALSVGWHRVWPAPRR